MIHTERWYREADDKALSILERGALSGDPKAYAAYWRQLERLGYPKHRITEELIKAVPRGKLEPDGDALKKYWEHLVEWGLPEDRITRTLVKWTPSKILSQVLPGLQVSWGREEWNVATGEAVDEEQIPHLNWQIYEPVDWSYVSMGNRDHPFQYLIAMLDKAKTPGGDVWTRSSDFPGKFENWSNVLYPTNPGPGPVDYHKTRHILGLKGPHAEKLSDLAWKISRA